MFKSILKPKRITKTAIIWVSIAVLSLILAGGIQLAWAAWQEPTEPPPGGNVSKPINVGSDTQAKQGGLTLGSGTPGSYKLTVVGDANIQSGLTVQGDTTLQALTATGATSLQSTLGVTGAATFSGGLTSTGTNYGVKGVTSNSSGYGVWGVNEATSGTPIGIYGSGAGYGVKGSGDVAGIYGATSVETGSGGYFYNSTLSGTGYGVYGKTGSATGYAGYFYGRVESNSEMVAQRFLSTLPPISFLPFAPGQIETIETRMNSKLRGVAFDGNYIWTGNDNLGGTIDWVTKFRASDGQIVAEYSLQDGHDIKDIAFDSKSIWASVRIGTGGGGIYKINRRTGYKEFSDYAANGTPKVYCWPDKILFDGTYLWVMNKGEYLNSDATACGAGGYYFIFKINPYPETGPPTIVEKYQLSQYPNRATWDGKYIWVVLGSGVKHLAKVNPEIGEVVYFELGATWANDILYDGKYLWTTHQFHEVTKIDPTPPMQTGIQEIQRINLLAEGYGTPIMTGITFDGTYVWAGGFQNLSDDFIFKIRVSDGDVKGYLLPTSYPALMTFDGTYVWLTDKNSNKIFKVYSGTGFGHPDTPSSSDSGNVITILGDSAGAKKWQLQGSDLATKLYINSAGKLEANTGTADFDAISGKSNKNSKSAIYGEQLNSGGYAGYFSGNLKVVGETRLGADTGGATFFTGPALVYDNLHVYSAYALSGMYDDGGEAFFAGKVGIAGGAPLEEINEWFASLNVQTDLGGSVMTAIYGKNRATAGTGGIPDGHDATLSGVYGESGLTGSAGSWNLGVYGKASADAGNTSGTTVGVFGKEGNAGTGNSYAGYFDGKVKIANGSLDTGFEINDTLCTNQSLCISNCIGNKKIVGGGCKVAGGQTIRVNAPDTGSTNGWRCQSNNVTNLFAYSICADIAITDNRDGS